VTSDCIFCDRLAGRDFWIPVIETDHSVAAVANHQRSTGSLIVIPRRHALRLPDLPEPEALDLLHTIRRAAAAVERTYDPSGLYVWQGGRIPLAHIHARICPRYDGIPYTFAPNSQLSLTPLQERYEIGARLAHCADMLE
jgi:histidine triad (HIT) family protein